MSDWWKRLVAQTPARIALALAFVLVASVLVVRGADLVGTTAEPTPTPSDAVVAEATPTATPTATDTATPSPTATEALAWKTNGGGAKNIVIASNKTDTNFLMRGKMKMGRTGAQRVAPVNLAFAKSTCTDCQTFAAAAQITLYRRGAPQVTPQNAAVAVNAGCQRCVTGAWAIQYVIPVDDPNDVPKDVDALVKDLNRELHDVEQAANKSEISVYDAFNRLNGLLDRFRAIGAYLYRQSQIETIDDSPSPQPTEPVEPSPDVTDEPSATPEATSPEPTATP